MRTVPGLGRPLVYVWAIAGFLSFPQFFTVSVSLSQSRRKSFRPTWQVDLYSYSWIARDLLSFSLNKKVRHNLWHNVGVATTSCLTQF